MNFDQALAYLLSLGHETLTIKLGLKNTETLLKALGEPQRDFRAVQIAGTNGKGSVAVMLESICRNAGVRAGLFTSPHLVSITERISIGGRQITKEEFAQLTTVVAETAKQLVANGSLDTLPTFFEHVTAIALLAFRAAKAELAILETGLGGRLDSTTAAGADIVAITPIALDHEEYLGQTLVEIASEKAAIIKPGVTAIVGPQTPEALDVINRRCRAMNVQPILIDGEANHSTPGYRSRLIEATQDGRIRVTFETPNGVYEHVLVGLRGRHQVTNASVAVALAEALRNNSFEIPDRAIVRGLKSASHAGRLELWDGQPPLLFDGAHNPAAARMLRNYLDEFVQRPITMVFGAMKDKRLDEMGKLLFSKCTNLVLTEVNNPRSATLEDLRTAVSFDGTDAEIKTGARVREALNIATGVTPADGLICITGSLYLVGEAQEMLRNDSRFVAHQSMAQ